jgi:hypothetical protein
MVNKREFFEYMSTLYDEDYKDDDTYKTMKSILKIKDKNYINELKDLTTMTKRERLAYRHALAANGKELTPRQVDQYISMVDYALTHMQD